MPHAATMEIIKGPHDEEGQTGKLLHTSGKSEKFQFHVGQSYNEKDDVLKGEVKMNKITIDEITKHVSWITIFFVYFAYANIMFFGIVQEFIDKLLILLGWKAETLFQAPKGYAPLFKEKEYFWLRRVYQRIRDLFERPISGVPAPWFKVMDRKSDDGFGSFYFTGKEIECLNLCSYNYLGFAQNCGPVIDSVADSIRKYSYAAASPKMEGGNYAVVQELERTIARFVGKESAVVFAMGYATNSTTIAALRARKGTLIISDTLNHASIVCGCKDSSATVRLFKHNDPEDLEKVLRESIVYGQPKTRRPWSKIIIVVEGVYSMEGEICRLPEIIAIKKKYKAYLYVDEAHSIGALGKGGRGVCEHWRVNPSEVDILMGTFTKAFGSVGGYIASSKEVIDCIRHNSYSSIYGTSMSPPCAQQALAALKVIMGEDGTNEGELRLKQLHDNSNFFRKNLKKMGFHVFGDNDSPIVPMMIYHPGKLPGLSRTLLDIGIGVVVVGYPVTPLLLGRLRFCISAAHTKEDLEWALKHINDVGEMVWAKYGIKKDHSKKPKKLLSK